MSLLLVAVLLFFSSSSSVSSHQYYVSDNCSSVTHTPCNPLSVYAGNMSQYNNTIFYFIGTSSINFNFTMESVQNITLHGLDHSPTINCLNYYNYHWSTIINTSNHVSFSNLTFQHCYIYFEASSNITITGSIFKDRIYLQLDNTFHSKITSSVFDIAHLQINFIPPSVCYNELHHYSLTLTNVNMTSDYSYLALCLYHGTSYNLSVIFDNVNIISEHYGVLHYFNESLFSLYIANSSVSNSSVGLYSAFHTTQESTKCNIKGVQSQSTIVTEDSQFHNNKEGLSFNDYYQFSNHHIIITVKSCSVHGNHRYGLFINGRLSTSTYIISVINTELIGNRGNEITGCHSIILNNITVTNSLSTGLEIIASVVTVKNRLVFKNNTGVVGGGIAINSSSVMALSSSAHLEFIDNHASYKGGGMYIDYKTCYFLSDIQVPLTLKDNTAGVAGNDIYGRINYFNDLFNSKNPSTSSDPTAFALCDPDSNETTPIWHDDEEQSVFPGQALKYRVALFGRSNGAISYSVTDGRLTVEINGTLIDKYITNCSLIEYTPKYINYGRHNITLNSTIVTTYNKYDNPSILNDNPSIPNDKTYRYDITFILNKCPTGFRVNSSGVCDCSVSRENVTCDINSLKITHNGLLWIGTYDTSTPFNANATNPNACIINEDCLLYCSPNPVTFQLNDTDTQCVDNRRQRMCGSCRDGYSLLMGSNKCGHCNNDYMIIGWIALFAVMGVLLVVLVIALNLTVSVGTMNGLLFYANIVKLYEPVFSRKGALPVLHQVVSWINLDFGFEVCFYNGMDSYAKQWLQFAFPLYLWIIIIIIIQLCRRYGKISRLMGSHAVPVLSTLFLLSYTKLVRTIVVVLHKREVTLHCTDGSVRSVNLWYEDPNVEYAKGKHAGLFGFAMVSVFFVIPYTLFLLLNPFYEKYLSNLKLLRKFWSHFKPIIDAYSGPMKDEYRFWPGLLLVARIPVLLSVTLVDSFIQSQHFLLSMLLTVLAILLSLSHCFGGVYKKRMNSVLEVWFLFNLCIMASLSVAFTDESKVLIWYNTCLSVFIFSFILIVVYHLYLQLSHMKCYDALIKKLFKKKDEDDEPLLDVTESHKTVDQQMREIVPSSTDVRLSTSRESVVDLF